MALEIVRQLEPEGHFPQAHYAFDKGHLTVELTHCIESAGGRECPGPFMGKALDPCTESGRG
jgi:hypothetical protein